MRIVISITSACVLALFGVTSLTAAPCATGMTTDATGKKDANDTSSNTERKSTANVSPGAKSESPGTVGAMNSVGSNTQLAPGEARPAQGKVVKPGADDC